MAYEIGDVILVPFPFTDLSGTRVRPAVVVSAPSYNTAFPDIIVAMVTSQPQSAATDYELRDWRQAGLLLPSWFRAKLATLQQDIVQLSPGRLSARDARAVAVRLRRALGL